MKTPTSKNQSHSDALRQKRNQHSQLQVNRASAQARHPSNHRSTTVQSRDTLFGRPVLQRTRMPDRRQYRVSVNNGAELLLRNIPVIRPGWRLFSGFLVIALTIAIIYLWNSPRLVVSNLEIVGIKRLDAADVESVLGLNGSIIFKVDSGLIVKDMEANFSELADITVQVLPPARVIINVRERVPMVTWEFNEKTLWIDLEGAMFPKRGTADTLITVRSGDAPPSSMISTLQENEITLTQTLGNGPINKQASPLKVEDEKQIFPSETSLRDLRVDPIILETAVKLSTMLPMNSELAFSVNEGMGFRDEDWDVFVGLDLHDMDEKLIVYDAIINRLKKEGVNPSMISVQNPDAPYYRVE
jgi:hypothetical protein